MLHEDRGSEDNKEEANLGPVVTTSYGENQVQIQMKIMR